MILVIPESIQKKELRPLEKYWTGDELIKIAQKVGRGLGVALKGLEKGSLVKIDSTFGNISTRSVFLLVTDHNEIIPIITRTKNDLVGQNLSFRNKAFEKLFWENYRLIQEDLEGGRFEVIEL